MTLILGGAFLMGAAFLLLVFVALIVAEPMTLPTLITLFAFVRWASGIERQKC